MRKNPIKLNRVLTLNQVYIHRHPFCKYDNKCLNKAIKNEWKSFSCLKCPFFRKYKKINQQKNEICGIYMQEIWSKSYIIQ
jgi:hypothetical protein